MGRKSAQMLIDRLELEDEENEQYTNLLGIDDPSTTVSDNLATTDVIEGRILTDTDWQDAILRTSISTDHNLSARANLFGKIPFRASLGYNNSQGLVKTSDYERFTYSLKLTPKFLDDHLKIDVNAKGTVSEKNAIDEGGSLGGAIAMDPTKPIYDNSPNNRFGGYYQGTKVDGNNLILDGQWNPVAILQQRQRPERAMRVLANIEFDYKMHFLPELRAVVNFGLDASKSRISESYSDNSIATYKFNTANTDINTNYLFNPGENYRESQHKTNTTLDAYLAYSKNFEGVVKKFDVQAGYSYQNFKNDGNSQQYRYNNVSGVRELVVNPSNPNNRYFSPGSSLISELPGPFGPDNANEPYSFDIIPVMAFGSCCSNCSKDNSTFGSVFKSSVQAVIPASKKILKLNNLIFFIFLFLKI